VATAGSCATTNYFTLIAKNGTPVIIRATAAKSSIELMQFKDDANSIRRLNRHITDLLTPNSYPSPKDRCRICIWVLVDLIEYDAQFIYDA
jgi:hypothetical protein